MEKQLIDGICFTFLKVRSLLMPQHLKGQQINSGSLMVILKKNFSPCHHIMSNVVSCRKLMRRFPNSNPKIRKASGKTGGKIFISWL